MTGPVAPRPIAWIVIQDPAGPRNAAPFSFFNVLCSWPPILAVGIQSRPDGNAKDTLANVAATSEFVVNLVPAALVEAMNATPAPVDPDTDELALFGLTTFPSVYVAPPRIAASPAAVECRRRQSIALFGDRTTLLGDVVATHVRAVIDAGRGQIEGGWPRSGRANARQGPVSARDRPVHLDRPRPKSPP